MEWLAVNGNGEEGARVLSDALKTSTSPAVLVLSGEQQDHKETQQESKTAIARGVTGQTTTLVLKERVQWVMYSRQTQH